MNKPKLLFLSHRVPFPPHNGAAIRTYNILRGLSGTFEIRALCFDRPDPATIAVSLEEKKAEIGKFASVSVFAIPQTQSRIRMVSDHLRALITGRPYTYYMHDSPEAIAAAMRAVEEFEPDVIHVDSIDLVRFLPILPSAKVVLTHHNVESALLRSRSSAEHGMLRRMYVRLQASRVESAERYWAPRVALNCAVSSEDGARLQKIAGGGEVLIVPNGVDTEFFVPSPAIGDGSIVFVGGTSWHPNLDALRWFSSDILPALRRRGVTAPVNWVGRCTDAERAEFQKDGLAMTGYVPDIRPFLEAGHCFIVPMRIGGGTRLKVVDAWAMGKAVVSTPLGVEGFSARPGEHFLVAEGTESFADEVERVLSEDVLRGRLGAAGRTLVEACYSWSGICREVVKRYLQISSPNCIDSPQSGRGPS